MGKDRHGLDVLDRQECLALLGSVPVGRLGLSIDALPVIVPVNFVLDGDRIIIGTGEGSKFDAAVAGVVVCFEADYWDPLDHHGWSVLVQGPTWVVTDERDLERCRRLPLRPWGQPEDLRYVAIGVEVLSGRRLNRVHERAGAYAPVWA